MKLRFTRQAKQDLDNIADYIREQNPEAALRVRAAIIRSLQTLVLFPRIGRRQAVRGVRKLVTRRHKYLIYYIVEGSAEEIVILTIQHPAREREHTDA
jgi:toxin ParE1/3/4